jgi:hypothetical protein
MTLTDVHEADRWLQEQQPQGNGRLLLGIDPGVSGALAMLCAAEGRSLAATPYGVLDMPVMRTGKGKSQRKEPDWHALFFLLSCLVREEARLGELHVIWECNQPFAADGKYGWRLNGLSTGYFRGWFLALGLPTTEIIASDWKPEFKLIGKTKDASRKEALRVWADAPCLRESDHNRAEALLISAYLWRTLHNQLRKT